MKNQPTVFIYSDNHDFIEALSSVVTHELDAACIAVAQKSEITQKPLSILVTNDTEEEAYPVPTIKVNLPVRLNRLATEIKSLFSKLPSIGTTNITPELTLSLQHKNIYQTNTGISIDLTDKETQLLHIIAWSGEAGISREQLMKEIWNIDAELDTHTLETHIYRLRKKIKDAFGNEIIRAIEGGYKL